MAKMPSFSVNFNALQEKVRGQFVGLDPNNPAEWPTIPRNLLYFGVCILVVTALWFVWLSDSDAQLTEARNQEFQLREDYKKKVVQAVNRDALMKQLEQVQQYVIQLERQLPSKAEMDALLSDINQAGLGRSLQFELFRPGQVNVKQYYAELPIALKVTGRYHDLALFAADVASLSRIVTLNNLTILPLRDKPGMMTLDGTAKTFRYLDQDEIAAQQKAGSKSQGSK